MTDQPPTVRRGGAALPGSWAIKFYDFCLYGLLAALRLSDLLRRPARRRPLSKAAILGFAGYASGRGGRG
jgi:hypothetical protein